MHINTGNSAVAVGCVIITARFGVNAGGVNGRVPFSAVGKTAALYPFDRAEDVKKLADRRKLVAVANRVFLVKYRPYKSGH